MCGLVHHRSIPMPNGRSFAQSMADLPVFEYHPLKGIFLNVQYFLCRGDRGSLLLVIGRPEGWQGSMVGNGLTRTQVRIGDLGLRAGLAIEAWELNQEVQAQMTDSLHGGCSVLYSLQQTCPTDSSPLTGELGHCISCFYIHAVAMLSSQRNQSNTAFSVS